MTPLPLLKSTFPGVEIVAGNIATAEAAESVDQGRCRRDQRLASVPGSICTTPHGLPVSVFLRLPPLWECSRVARKYGVPLIADGGIKYSGDLPKAVTAGADCIMIGSLFAGTEESPGDTVLYQGRNVQELSRHGLHRRHAGRKQGSLFSIRCGGRRENWFPKASKGWCRCADRLSANIHQVTGGASLRNGVYRLRDHRPIFRKTGNLSASPAPDSGSLMCMMSPLPRKLLQLLG